MPEIDLQRKTLRMLVTGDLMWSPTDYFNSLNGAYFTNPVIAQVYKITRDFYFRNNVMPIKSVLVELVTRELQKSPDTAVQVQVFGEEIKYIYDLHIDREDSIDALVRNMILEARRDTLSIKLPGAIESGNMRDVIKELEELELLEGGDDTSTGYYYFRDADNREEMYRKMAEHIIPSGYPSIDRVLNFGGFLPGDLVVLLGAYGVGKTTMLCNFAAKAIKAGRGVIYISLESEIRDITRLVDCILTGESRSNLHQVYEERVKNQLKQYAPVDKDKEYLYIQRWDSNTMTVPEVERHIVKALAKIENPQLVIIDYGELLKPSEKPDRHDLGITSVFLQLKEMGSRRNLVTMCSTQGNRDAIDKAIVGGKQLGDSIGKGKPATHLFGISRTTDHRRSGTCGLYIDKNREGPDKLMLYFKLDGNTGTLTEDTVRKATLPTHEEVTGNSRRKKFNKEEN